MITAEYADHLERLIDALAECIVAYQGKTNRERAKLVLAEIDAQGFGLLPHDEIEKLRAALQMGVTMRERQKTYFKSRDRGDLIASKEAESMFDKAAKP